MHAIRLPLLFLLSTLILLTTLPARAGTTPPSAEVEQALAPALWEIVRGDTRITLFGTVHALPRDVDWFQPHVVAALDNADRLVMETVPPDNSSTIIPIVMRLARLRNPHPLLLRVPLAERPVLQAAIDRLNPPPLDWFKDWYIALTLANLASSSHGLDPRIGVESVLAERARIKNVPIEGLETIEQQLVYFDALTPADQTEMLLTTLRDLPDSRQRLDAMLAAWLRGDTDALALQLDQGFRKSPMLRRMLVEDRNERWAYWIFQQMEKQKGHIFLAVGAGHFAGEKGLLALLGTYGLEAKRVRAASDTAPRR